MEKDKKLIVVNSCDEDEFINQCNSHLENGYELHSSSCGFINSEEYDFCNVWNAIFIKKEQ